jgi:hypothetical protein
MGLFAMFNEGEPRSFGRHRAIEWLFASAGLIALWRCGGAVAAPEGGAGPNGVSNGTSVAHGAGGGPSDVASGIPFMPDPTQCTTDNQCVVQCAIDMQRTTLRGVVYDPAGIHPMSGVSVYIPSTTQLDPLPKGASCAGCNYDQYKNPISSAVTDVSGSFTIIDPPIGPSIPLVVQAGKWRAMFTASVQPCVDNRVATRLHLPRSASDGPGAWVPDIAVSTGGLDSLECFLTRIGVDPKEYTNGASTSGHIHIFQGGVGGSGVPGPQMAGGSPSSAQALWNSAASLQSYDAVLLSCEGAETEAPNPAALETYLKNGGRVFASHFHYAWFTAAGSPFQTYDLGQFQAGSEQPSDIDAVVDTSFAQGQTFHDWLAQPQVAALIDDKLPIRQSRQNVRLYNNPPVTSWLNADSMAEPTTTPGLTEYLSFDITMGELFCGRVLYSDFHVGGASADYGDALNRLGSTRNGVVPDGCDLRSNMSPQETVLEYMLFNLPSCTARLRLPPPGP